MYLPPGRTPCGRYETSCSAPLAIIFRMPQGKPNAPWLPNSWPITPGAAGDARRSADGWRREQFAVLLPVLEKHGENGQTLLAAEVDRTLPPKCPPRTSAGRSWRSGRPMRRWPCCGWAGPIRSGRCCSRGEYLTIPGCEAICFTALARSRQILETSSASWMTQKQDVSIRRALLLSLGEFGASNYRPPTERRCLPGCCNCTATTPTPGCRGSRVVAAAMEAGSRTQEIDQAWANDSKRRDERLERIERELARNPEQSQAAMVRQRPGADDGRDSWPGGVPDGIADNGSRTFGAIAAQGEDRPNFAIAAKSVTAKDFQPVFSTITLSYRSGLMRTVGHTPDEKA